MLIFCGFRSLPSQSQVPDSLLRLCSQALFCAQRRVVLPLRGGFQALLSGCTILPIISCSSVALSKCLQMVGQHRPTRVHTGRDAGSVFVWVMSKNPRHSSPCAQGRRLVHQFRSGRFLCHQVGCIIHHPHLCKVYCNSTFGKCSAICTMASDNLAGSSVMLSLDATNNVNQWFLTLPVGAGQGGGGTVIRYFFFRGCIFF